MPVRQLSYREAIREALSEEMRRDDSVFLLGEDIGSYGGAFGVTRGLLDAFGKERIIDTPISENSFVGIAIGAAMLGLRPVVEIMFMDFILLAMDQIVNHMTKFEYIYNGQVRIPMVIRTPAGGGRGYGATHSQNLESMFLGVPGLTIVAPHSPEQAKKLMIAAIRHDGPVLFVENKLLYDLQGPVSNESCSYALGKGVQVENGGDATLVTYARTLDLALEASRIFKMNNIDIEVINLLSIKPFDVELICKSVEKTGRLVIVEEGNKVGGIGSEIAASVLEMLGPGIPISRVGAEDTPVPCSRELEMMWEVNVDKIVSGVEKVFR